MRLVFILAAMKNLDVCAADISTAFLHWKTREKVYIITGKEYGRNEGKRMILDKWLYGLASNAV